MIHLDSYIYADLPLLLRESARLTVQSPSQQATSQAMLAQIGRETEGIKPAFFDQINLDEALQIYSVVRSIEPNSTMEIVNVAPRQRPRGINLRIRLKKLWAKFAARVRFLEHFLAPEVLRPWCLLEAPDLLLLKKVKEDDRDWRFHRSF